SNSASEAKGTRSKLKSLDPCRIVTAKCISQNFMDDLQPCRFCEDGNPCRFHRPQRPEDKARRSNPRRSRGFRIAKLKRKLRRRPAWTTDPCILYIVCLSHPQCRRYGQRWARIAWLYFFENKPAAEIAELLGGSETKKSVQRVIERLNARAARLLTA